MKKIEIVLRTERVERVLRDLRKAGVPRLTVTHVHSVGSGVDPENYQLAFEEGAAYTEHAKITVIVGSDEVSRLVDVVCESACTGHRGDGVIFVSGIERVVKIRTGVEDAMALL